MAWHGRMQMAVGKARLVKGLPARLKKDMTYVQNRTTDISSKVLKGQGPAAQDGEMDFVVKGVMIGGLALVSSPAEYGVTGVRVLLSAMMELSMRRLKVWVPVGIRRNGTF
jgi:hypothetical protein